MALPQREQGRRRRCQYGLTTVRQVWLVSARSLGVRGPRQLMTLPVFRCGGVRSVGIPDTGVAGPRSWSCGRLCWFGGPVGGADPEDFTDQVFGLWAKVRARCTKRCVSGWGVV